MSDRVAVGEYTAVIAEHFGVVLAVGANTEYADYDRLFAVNPWGVIHGTKPFLINAR